MFKLKFLTFINVKIFFHFFKIYILKAIVFPSWFQTISEDFFGYQGLVNHFCTFFPLAYVLRGHHPVVAKHKCASGLCYQTIEVCRVNK